MSEKPLTQDQIAVLVELKIKARGSLKAHVPKHAILAHFRKDFRGYAGEALEQLVRLGCVVKHPTRGEMIYSLTLEGIRRLKELGLFPF